MSATKRKRIKRKIFKQTCKGALVKGFLEKKDRKGFELLLPRYREVIGDSSGIYALYKSEKLYYVGLTRDLFGRIYWHQRDRHAGKWNKFIIFRIKRVGYLKDIETIIHNIVKTKGNKVRGRVPIDSDLNRVLREILMERGKEYKKLKEVFDHQ